MNNHRLAQVPNNLLPKENTADSFLKKTGSIMIRIKKIRIARIQIYCQNKIQDLEKDAALNRLSYSDGGT
jgi:hypothetical protein